MNKLSGFDAHMDLFLQPPGIQQTALQIQPSLISQQAVAAATVAQQQYAVPVSMVESGRQMLLTNAVQTTWPENGRQMTTIVPSWQPLPPHNPRTQQSLLGEPSDWGRPLIVDGSAILQVDIRGMICSDVMSSLYWDGLIVRM
ncbi:hypothetical protein QAD02_013941 [Eretmocerus hayati]|uniref:Uncharacterized protein n=1 Tax=Eretmocerus hayati TaxID=131215 RepID=A0ACC2P6F8_9HYME|nr:hypothetical protein QAD02_013941 [Eretmocerus hayati]